jgi:hypothetical protein
MIMEECLNFYEPFFENYEATKDFVERCEALTPNDTNHVAKIMMHQTQRLVSIADDIAKIRRKRESLQLLFIIICAEHISKLHDNFDKEGQSRKYVHRFFKEFLTQSDKHTLEITIMDTSVYPNQPYDLKQAVDLFYKIRCDVVHEGNYWSFTFRDGIPMVNADPDVVVSLQFKELRDIVIRGCIYAIKEKLC